MELEPEILREQTVRVTWLCWLNYVDPPDLSFNTVSGRVWDE